MKDARRYVKVCVCQVDLRTISTTSACAVMSRKLSLSIDFLHIKVPFFIMIRSAV